MSAGHVMRYCGFILILGLLGACTSPAARLFDKHAGPDVTRDNFVVCHNFSCLRTEQVGLTDDEWARISELYEPMSDSAEQERSPHRTIHRFAGANHWTQIRHRERSSTRP